MRTVNLTCLLLLLLELTFFFDLCIEPSCYLAWLLTGVTEILVSVLQMLLKLLHAFNECCLDLFYFGLIFHL